MLEVSRLLCQKSDHSPKLAEPFLNQTVTNYCNRLDDEKAERVRKKISLTSGNLSFLAAIIIGGLCTTMGLIAICFWRLRVKHYKKGNINGPRGRNPITEGEEQRERLASNEGGGSVDMDDYNIGKDRKISNDDDEKRHFNGFVKKQISRCMFFYYNIYYYKPIKLSGNKYFTDAE